MLQKNMVRSFCSGHSKKISTLLTEIVAGYEIITLINIMKASLERTFTRVLCSNKSGFHYCINDVLYIFICINSLRGFGALIKAAANILRGFEGGTRLPISLLETPRKGDGNLDKIEFASLVKTQL